jgi:thiol-disulfide isomerase/thioredoxin
VKLAEFSGKIVVLDFFAYWCAPCKQASVVLEEGVQKYYAGKRGNPNGVSVQVVSVNIESQNPGETDSYIRETGAELVVNDVEGALLDKLGGTATPYIVIIDGTQVPSGGLFRVAYRKEGLDSVKAVRGVIDRLGQNSPGSSPADPGILPTSVDDPKPFATLRAQTMEAGMEIMSGDDIILTDSVARYKLQTPRFEVDVSLGLKTFSLDYEPFAAFDVIGRPQHLRENQYSGGLAVRHKWSDSLTQVTSFGAYDGFTDYRSLWLSSYYRQQFDSFPEYELPDPRGFNAATGWRWEYRPTVGFLDVNFFYGNDAIAPGYDLPDSSPQNPTPALERGREFLHTYSPSLRFENVLTSRLRLLNEFQLTVTSGRDPRYSYRSGLNVALAEKWVMRLNGGYANEDPSLIAWYAGWTVEYSFTPRWVVGLTGRFYRDTGEIENSRLISTAAPALDTFEIGFGLRYEGRRSIFKLYAAPHYAYYDRVDIGTAPFTNLYRSRNFGLFQLSWSHKF